MVEPALSNPPRRHPTTGAATFLEQYNFPTALAQNVCCGQAGYARSNDQAGTRLTHTFILTRTGYHCQAVFYWPPSDLARLVVPLLLEVAATPRLPS